MLEIDKAVVQTAKAQQVKHRNTRQSIPHCAVLPDERVCQSARQVRRVRHRQLSMANGCDDDRHPRAQWKVENLHGIASTCAQ